MSPATPTVALLALDTATSRAVVSLGAEDGILLRERAWAAGHRHGEELLAAVRDLLAEAGSDVRALRAIVVGTGPGAFTGLRVGLATAKGLGSALGIPLVGVSTGAALLDAVASDDPDARAIGTRALLLPAGPSDRVLVRDGAPVLVPAAEPVPADAAELVAVDLAGRAEPRAVARGERALDGLGAALVRLGAARLARGEADDPARLVPEYVSLPRGVRATSGEVAWSRARP